MKLAIVLLCLSYVSAQNPNTSSIISGATNTIGGLGGAIVSGLGTLTGRNYGSEGDDSDSDEHNVDGAQDDYDTVKIIAGYKYPVEEYSVVTDDGYILQIHRIPSKDSSENSNSVLIMGDFWTSSVYWVLSGPKYSLAFYLANLGYDVWLGNNRGGKYGQQHKILQPDDPAFWYYSVHEWGVYDLPAIIDFILSKIECDKLSYIGWGFGATEFFVMASEKPDYVLKIKNMQALAPAVYNQHTRCRIKTSAVGVDEESLYAVAGRGRLIPSPRLLDVAGRGWCLSVAQNKKSCNYLESLAHEAFNIDIPGYPEVSGYPLIQGSMRFLIHIIQSIKKGFRLYDHGEASNLLYYGKKCPPKYNIKAADLPIAIYYSDDDAVSAAEDDLRLSIDLPKLIRAFHIKEKDFGFVDFPLSKSGIHCYYPNVYEVLKRYNDY